MIRLFNVFIPASVVALLFSETVLLFSCFILACFTVQPADPEIFLFYERGIERITIVVASILVGLYMNDLYTKFRIRSTITLLQQTCLVIGVAFLVQAFISYFDRDWMLPRWIMMTGSILCLLSLPLWRLLYATFVIKALGQEKVLLVGTSEVLLEIASRLKERPELGFEVAGYVDDTDGRAPAPDLLRTGELAQIRQIAAEVKPDLIVVGMSERRARMPVYDMLELRLSGTRIEEAGTLYEVAFGRVSTRELKPSHLIFSAELGPRPGMVMLQNLYSFAIAFITAIIVVPVMLIVAILVKLTSPGPILYRQTRVGQHGRPFVLYKFRSMRVDAESATGAVWAKKDDPRVTPLGGWLRKLRLDELPQLFNVLRGDMAVVGPRPERPEFVKTLSEKIPYYHQRHCVKPGITGWAQINHKYGDTLEDTIIKLEYDLYYIKNLAMSLDAYIMFHTAKVMLLTRGSQ
jgi:sugar transferase (PEP-CTERM system associated)